MSKHEEEYLDDENWFEIAQKENIRLECNRCSNSFLSGKPLEINFFFEIILKKSKNETYFF